MASGRHAATLMTPMAQPFEERLWWAAHASASRPGWAAFQLLAVREGGRRLAGPFAVGCVLAVAGGLLLRSGADWLDWARRSAQGPSPDVEIAGFAALDGLVASSPAAISARRRGFRGRCATRQ